MGALTARKHRRATYADIVALPSNVTGEIIDGTLIATPRPAIPHATATSVLHIKVGDPFYQGSGGPGGWVILFEPELHLGEAPDIVVPDLAGWRRARMPVIPDTAFLTLAPDWVCEVMSPGTEAVDRAKKTLVYAREKVGHVWLVNPATRTLEVLRLEGETWRILGVHHGDVTVRAEPFDAIEIDLSAPWAR